MKVTDTQKQVIDICIKNLESWRDTNDIDSPSHEGYIDESFWDSKVDESDLCSLKLDLEDLLKSIKVLNRENYT